MQRYTRGPTRILQRSWRFWQWYVRICQRSWRFPQQFENLAKICEDLARSVRILQRSVSILQRSVRILSKIRKDLQGSCQDLFRILRFKIPEKDLKDTCKYLQGSSRIWARSLRNFYKDLQRSAPRSSCRSSKILQRFSPGLKELTEKWIVMTKNLWWNASRTRLHNMAGGMTVCFIWITG